MAIKLSPTQMAVLRSMCNRIHAAKESEASGGFETYYNFHDNFRYFRSRGVSYSEFTTSLQYADEYKSYRRYYDELLKNTLCTFDSSATLNVLERLGYIRIIKLGGKSADWIEVLGPGLEFKSP